MGDIIPGWDKLAIPGLPVLTELVVTGCVCHWLAWEEVMSPEVKVTGVVCCLCPWRRMGCRSYVLHVGWSQVRSIKHVKGSRSNQVVPCTLKQVPVHDLSPFVKRTCGTLVMAWPTLGHHAINAWYLPYYWQERWNNPGMIHHTIGGVIHCITHIHGLFLDIPIWGWPGDNFWCEPTIKIYDSRPVIIQKISGCTMWSVCGTRLAINTCHITGKRRRNNPGMFHHTTGGMIHCITHLHGLFIDIPIWGWPGDNLWCEPMHYQKIW